MLWKKSFVFYPDICDACGMFIPPALRESEPLGGGAAGGEISNKRIILQITLLQILSKSWDILLEHDKIECFCKFWWGL